MVALGLLSGGCGVSRLSRFVGLGPHDVTRPPSESAAHAPSSGIDPRLAEFREQAMLAPREPYWPFRIAETCVEADSLPRAQAALRECLRLDPCYAPALSLLSKLEFDAGRHDDAIRMLEAARSGASPCPGDFPPALLMDLALHYDAIDRADLADSLFRAIPEGARRSLGSSGVYLILRGSDPAPAAALAEAEVREHPRSAVSQNNYGIVKLRAGDLADARQAFERAIELDAALAGPYYNLAILEKFYAFDDQAAAKRFQEYRARSNADPDGLADVFDRSGAKELAQKRGEK